MPDPRDFFFHMHLLVVGTIGSTLRYLEELQCPKLDVKVSLVELVQMGIVCLESLLGIRSS